MSEKYLHEMIDDIEVLIDEAKPARFSPDDRSGSKRCRRIDRSE